MVLGRQWMDERKLELSVWRLHVVWKNAGWIGGEDTKEDHKEDCVTGRVQARESLYVERLGTDLLVWACE